MEDKFWFILQVGSEWFQEAVPPEQFNRILKQYGWRTHRDPNIPGVEWMDVQASGEKRAIIYGLDDDGNPKSITKSYLEWYIKWCRRKGRTL